MGGDRGRPPALTAEGYRRALRATVAAAAAPYGYTLTVWTSGAVVAHERGIPNAVGAILFALGAMIGFGLVGLIAYGGIGRRALAAPDAFSVWQSIHVLGIGAAIALAFGVARLVHNDAAWLVAGFAATAVYLLAAGVPHAMGRGAADDAGAA
jgi:hypothetical protein